jgi:hypothetical protein
MTSETTAAPASTPSNQDEFMEKYRDEHKNPINHFLHVGVGWPMCAFAVILLPWRPYWSLGLFLGGYAFMWFGHFVFERNVPTIFKHPSTPFVVARAVIRGLARLAVPSRTR